MKRLALIQSAYIPWKGFFDFIDRCDEFIIYDTAAYSKGHWHNRNRIKTPQGAQWLTIPVLTAGKMGQPIDEVLVKPGWSESHWMKVAQAYGDAPCFHETAPRIRELYEAAGKEERLSAVNELFVRRLVEMMKLSVVITRDTQYSASGKRTDRVISLCLSAGATHYLSGPSASAYLETEKFDAVGVKLEWMQYGPYRPYAQTHGEFDHSVSIIDVLFNVGIDRWREAIAPAAA